MGLNLSGLGKKVLGVAKKIVDLAVKLRSAGILSRTHGPQIQGVAPVGDGRAAALEVAALGIVLDAIADVLSSPSFMDLLKNPRLLIHAFGAVVAIRVAAYLRSIVPIRKDASAAEIGAAVESVLNEPLSVSPQNPPKVINAALQDIITNPDPGLGGPRS